MRELTGDLWTLPADARCITTNGTIKRNGEAVMGRGCAWEAKQRYPELPAKLGESLEVIGNRVSILLTDPWLLSFPVKHEWHESADLELIRCSAIDLMQLVDPMAWTTVLLPRPGCGNGRLQWDQVREVIAPLLDDRIAVVSK